MRFYKLNEVPIRADDTVFKVPLLGTAIALFVCLGICVGLFVLGQHGGVHGGRHGLNLPPAIAYLLGAGFGLLPALICFGKLRAGLKPTNWLLRCDSSGIIIKYRSYLNWRMPAEDVQAVGFEYSEIAWVRQVKEQRDSPGLDGRTTRQYMTFLDLCLANPDTAELERHLEAERNRSWSFRVLEYPVEVLPGSIVRLKWRNAGGGVYSNPGKAVQWLGRFVRIAPEDASKVNLTHQRNLASAEEEARIRKLLKSGDKMGAVTLAREVYRCSLTEAMERVEKLTMEPR